MAIYNRICLTGNLSDSELLNLISEGGTNREAAFRELFGRYSKKVYFYCRKFTGNNSIAQDITQDTFLKLLEYLATGKNADNSVSLIFRIAKNLCINSIKYEKRYESFDNTGNFSYNDRTNETKELAIMIESALELLPEDHKDAFCLQMYCGFSYEEIAEINNVPITTIRNWIVRAKIKLRKILSPYFEDSK